MKTKIATALSVVGVLGAGSAAALVNTQILHGGETESSASAAVLPPASTIDVEVPEITVPETTAPETTAPATTAPESSVPESSVPEPSVPGSSVPESSVPGSSVPESSVPASAVPAPSEFLTAFNVGEAGIVTVDVIDGKLVLVSAEAKDGWEVVEAEENDDNEVEVEFRSATVRVEFEASFVGGRIVTEVESYAIGVTATTSPSGGDDGHSDDDDSEDDASEDDASEDDRDDDSDHRDDDDVSDDDDSSGDRSGSTVPATTTPSGGDDDHSDDDRSEDDGSEDDDSDDRDDD
jgi:hypothetical protein